MLRGAGYLSINSTTDPTQVCELHLRNQYDLILLDLQMPNMNGFQVMENLKDIETGGYLPVLVITAQSDHKLRALNAGAKDFVSKPFALPEVLIRVQNMLEVRLLNLQTKKLNNRLLAEQKISERLLFDLLPQGMAEQFKGRIDVIQDSPTGLITEGYAEVTVLFADILAFTAFSESVSADVLSGVLDAISTRVVKSSGLPGITRANTIGDAYLAAVGLPDVVTDHSIRASNKAWDLIEAVDRFNEHSRYKLKLRIGFETGAEVATMIRKRNIIHDL